MEVIWAVVCYHGVGDAVDGFPSCNGEGWGFFWCVVVVAGFLISRSYFIS